MHRAFAVLSLTVTLGLGCRLDEPTGAAAEAIAAAECNPSTGTGAAPRVCSPNEPCERLYKTEPQRTATEPSTMPDCREDGPARSRLGEDGTLRFWCEFQPSSATPENPLPLVVWLHGAFATAEHFYSATSLRDKASSFRLNPDRPGFISVAVQARNLHWPTPRDRDGAHHDHFFRDLSSPSTNPDIANIDGIIDELVASGIVDPTRIYVIGWSNGGHFAQMYAIARHEVTTPGGNRVAAALAYSSADPFNNIGEGIEPSCQLQPYPTSRVPIHIISRSCDLIACDQAQADALLQRGVEVLPGAAVEPWIERLRDEIGADASWTRLTAIGTRTSRCRRPLACSTALALANHVNWPDGIYDGSGNDYEYEMLGFFADHPLSANGY